jgi:hypothetical protein
VPTHHSLDSIAQSSRLLLSSDLQIWLRTQYRSRKHSPAVSQYATRSADHCSAGAWSTGWAIESREWRARGEDEAQLSSDTGQYHAGITAAPKRKVSFGAEMSPAKVVVGWQGSGADCSEAEEEESIYSGQESE